MSTRPHYNGISYRGSASIHARKNSFVEELKTVHTALSGGQRSGRPLQW
jgi:hypothetical protein